MIGSVTIRRLTLLLVALCLWPFATSVPAREAQVWLALSEDGVIHREAAAAVSARLGRSVSVLTLPWQELLAVPRPPPRLVVTLGCGAFRAFVEKRGQQPPPTVPLLATLITRSVYEREIVAYPAAHSAQFLDQPFHRQFRLIGTIRPTPTRVGVLLSPETSNLLPSLEKAAAKAGLRLVAAIVENEERFFRQLQWLLGDIDVLLALPDARVFNSQTIRNILTAAYRQRVPLVGFSAAYVRAGALLAIHATPTQAGQAAALAVRDFLTGGSLPKPGSLDVFDVSVNDSVARSLSLEVADGEKLADWLRQGEER